MIPAHQCPAYRSYDGPFGYTDALGRPGRCYLQIFESRGSLPLALACELPDNPGPSITNAASELATQIWQQLLPQAREGIRFVERYVDPPRGRCPGRALRRGDLSTRWELPALPTVEAHQSCRDRGHDRRSFNRPC